jgi:tripartite-type tricarboxylate transporter receptor subunit TctC
LAGLRVLDISTVVVGAAINLIVKSPEVADKFAGLGAIPRLEGPKEFGPFLASEDARWRAVVKASGVRIE